MGSALTAYLAYDVCKRECQEGMSGPRARHQHPPQAGTARAAASGQRRKRKAEGGSGGGGGGESVRWLSWEHQRRAFA